MDVEEKRAAQVNKWLQRLPAATRTTVAAWLLDNPSPGIPVQLLRRLLGIKARGL